tara:strand:- start:2758 stop:3153 length:396 start_codon:yes stop_codon:yes gene_type:complete
MKMKASVSTEDEDDHLNRVFHALSDSTRRAIVRRLSRSSGTVTALAEPFDMSLNAVSKHLKTLENAQLITREKIGRTSVCSLNSEALQNATEWICQYTDFWNEVLDSLETHLDIEIEADAKSAANDKDRTS